MSMIKVPRLYVVASKIAKAVKEDGASIKQLVYSHKYKHFNIKALYALVSETLARESVLETLLQRTGILTKEQHLQWDPWLVRILVTELLWRKHRLPLGGKRIQTVLNYEPELRKELKALEASGVPVEKPTVEVEKPRYVRVNTLVAAFEDVIRELQEQGWKYKKLLEPQYSDFLDVIANLQPDSFVQDMHVPDLLVFPRRTEFYMNPLYCSGAIVLQDKASLLPVHLLKPCAGSVVLDMCAAPGMKTTHIAAVMRNEGIVYAAERDANRYQTLCDLVQQYGATCVKTLHTDALTINADSCPDVEYILVDPSCSGSGMVDRVTSVNDKSVEPERLQRLARFQLLLLKHALTSFPAVKRVVYSTCSLNVEENEQVVEATYLHTRSGPSSHQFEISGQFVNDQWISRGSEEYEHGPQCLYARPHVDKTNGFFVAVFERLAVDSKQDTKHNDDSLETEELVNEVEEQEFRKKKLKKKKSKHKKIVD